MPVVILGFHRSGTSMVTRLLNQCGLYLGPAEMIMPPSVDDNPEGYWEHLSVVNLNDQILSALGGSWRNPPTLPTQWTDQPNIQGLMPQAKAAFLGYEEPWGWKDPRTMLTLKFWLTLFPKTRFVLCVRNPLEIKQSLSTGRTTRDFSSKESLDLWLKYHCEMLRWVGIEHMTITHYDSYLYNPVRELQRILNSLGIAVPPAMIIQASNSIKMVLKHQNVPEIASQTLLDSEISALYQQFGAFAGDIYEALTNDVSYQAKKMEAYLIKRQSIELQFESQIGVLKTAVQTRETVITQLTEQAEALQVQSQGYALDLAEQGRQLTEQSRQLAEREQQLIERERQLIDIQQKLIHSLEQASNVQKQILQQQLDLQQVQQDRDELQYQLQTERDAKVHLQYIAARGELALSQYRSLKNRLSIRLLERYMMPFKRRFPAKQLLGMVFREEKKPSDIPLRCVLDKSVATPLLVGSGTILALRGWCYHPLHRIVELQILFRGQAYPVICHSSPREDVMAEHVPHVDSIGNSLNSGFEAFVQIEPINQAISADLSLRARLSNQQIMEADLGNVALLPDLEVEKPSLGHLAQQPCLAICMATFNPRLDLFIDQINSIREQTFENWICIINDDCSSPELFAEIRRIVAGDRRFVVYQNEQRLGFYHNFETCLMRVPTGIDFVAFADQDDHWYPDKLEVTLAAFEADVTLVYCDTRLVTDDSNVLAPTFWAGRENNFTDLVALIIANTVTGAASIFRASLLAQALPFPERFWDFYHDGWLACVALSSGRIVYIDRPLYDYHQHSGNVVGHKLLPIKRFPSLQQILLCLLNPQHGVATFDRYMHADYPAYWGIALRFVFIARMLLLRLPNLTEENRRQLQQFGKLPPSVVGWLPYAIRYRRRRYLTFGLEWLAVRSLISKQHIDDHFKRDQAAHIQQHIDHLLANPTAALPDTKSPPAPFSSEEIMAPIGVVSYIAPLRLDICPEVIPRINIVLSTIDFRYVFGGYIAMFNLAMQLDRAGYKTRIVLTQETNWDLPAWRKEFPRYPGLAEFLDRIEIAYHFDRSIPLVVSPSDKFIATSWWTAHIVHRAARDLGQNRFIFFIQDYEPLFYPGGDYYAFAQQAYTFPHFAIFSTELLRDYFKLHHYGVFTDGEEVGTSMSLTIQNAILRSPITIQHLRRNPAQKRKLLFYARPEEHARRNLFELGLLGIIAAIEKGILNADNWEFYGIGSLGGSEHLRLKPYARMTLLPKMSFQDYHHQLTQYDLGISLMLTPHPSLVPLDMAAAGIITITNTFETKTAEALQAISANIIAVPPTVDGIAAGIRSALNKISSYEERVAGADLAWAATWDEALGGSVMEAIAGFLEAIAFDHQPSLPSHAPDGTQ